jgi:hypothetical protein
MAHVIVDEVCKRAIEEGFAVTHYLDHFNYFAPPRLPSKLTFASSSLKQVDASTSPSPPTQHSTFGLQYNLLTKTVTVPRKSLASVRDAHDSFLAADFAVRHRALGRLLELRPTRASLRSRALLVSLFCSLFCSLCCSCSCARCSCSCALLLLLLRSLALALALSFSLSHLFLLVLLLLLSNFFRSWRSPLLFPSLACFHNHQELPTSVVHSAC